MWLTLLAPTVDCAPLRLGGHELILQEAERLWEVRTRLNDEIQFLYFFMCFLSDHGRSGSLFVGSAISTTHFALVCAQRAWRGILGLNQPFGSENQRYVRSAIPNMLLVNIEDRLLVYLYDVMNLLIPSDAPFEESFKLTNKTIIQNIKVCQT